MSVLEQTNTFTSPDLSAANLARITRQIGEVAGEYDRSGKIPEKGLQIAHEAGLLTATVAKRFGGPELGQRDVSRILIALGEGDASVALLAANSLAAHRSQTVNNNWPREYYQDVLERSALGPTLINAVRAEPELGAPARGGLPATVATRTAEGWVVNGHKAYATGGTGLAYHVVWAVADEPDGDPNSPRVGHVIVPAHLPGITWIPTWDHLGLRASNTHDVTYENVTVSAEAFIEIPRQQDGSYLDPASAVVSSGLSHAALYIGVARAARSAFVEFANERIPAALGKPIAQTERIQSVAGEIEAQIAQAETLLYGAIFRAEAGDSEIASQLSVLKVQIVHSVITAVNTAVAALGNPALTRHGNFERLLRDILCARIHPPQEDTALIAAGRRILLSQK